VTLNKASQATAAIFRPRGTHAVFHSFGKDGGNTNPIVFRKRDMMNTTIAHAARPSFQLIVRWGARLLSALILLGWGFFAIAHLVGDAGAASRPLTFSDYLGLAMMSFSMAGLGAAWKWERGGAALTLVAVLLGALVNWRVLAFPLSLVPITASLFLLSWWMSRTRSK
jgi:hypothetical protein